MELDYELADLASSQAGYLGHDQAVSIGLSDDAIYWRLKQGVFTPAARGIYRVKGFTGDHRGLLRAATAILPDATASHESAAEIWGMPFVPRKRVVVTVHASTTHNFPGVRIHRSIDLFGHHRALVDGMPVTTPARTLNDLAAVLHPKHLAKVGDEALADRIVDFGDLKDAFHETARRGRTGSGPMRVFINERDGSKPIKASILERVGMGVFERGGIPRPEFQYPAPWDPTQRIDFAWPWCCVGCEADGRRWHTRAQDFQKDRARDNLALIHDWRIFRFTWEDFLKRPHLIVAQLKAAITT
ncbi:MAG TPA: type IV toxin-antitoxin system AbiEi family antitoxin domain-containing protein [Acidimicrobiia bacterium]|nr:type IV toxin-antitoxin system AbiEi family antitoxin domain-containing protein [Acidimicrobiia bacterium]